MYGILFEVEQAARIDFHLPVVLARILEPQPFTLGDDATLDGCRLQQVLEIPPSQRADGSPRLDLFAFALVEVEELRYFTPGAVVELRTSGPRVPG